MKLKQPAVPGIWGSWDPKEGSAVEERGRVDEWPDYAASVEQGVRGDDGG